MPSSSNKCPFSLSTVSGVSSHVELLLVAAATAAVTYLLTKRREDERRRKIAFQTYQKEKEAKSEVAAKRKAAKLPPSGTVLEGLSIDRVYVWKIEDLKKRYESADVINIMRNKPRPPAAIRSPILRSASSVNEDDDDDKAKSFDARSSLSVQGRHQHYCKLITDDQVILEEIVRKPSMPHHCVGFMRAGPREMLHFDPRNVSAAIVTCGGLCPGLNNVIREITKTLHQIYGISGTVYGIQGGYRGFYDPSPHLHPIVLTPELVEDIHHEGGTVLGSSRGGFDLDKILKFLKDKNVCQLYVIGGDGTHRGAFIIHEGCMERGMNVSVAGIPKTIDNDVNYIDHSFGFASAVEAAQVAIRSAKTEAVCNLPNGIGIVKLMGRSAGFIAAHATMASSDVDLCLVPEVKIVLEGEKGCLPHIMRRVRQQGYAVIVCAEGGTCKKLNTTAKSG